MSIHLQIPEPCHENWQNMQPNKDGRHCMACQKTVVDFSNMTDKEILGYISNAGGDICGRVDSFETKEKGEYRADLMDASGRIVWMRKIDVNEVKYNLSIPAQSTWSAGIYWLRISGNHTKKIYNGKIVIQ